MGWWLDTYNKAATADPQHATSINLAMALVFDRSGVTEGLTAPLEILEYGPVHAEYDVDDFLKATMGADAFTRFEGKEGRKMYPVGKPLVVLPYAYGAAHIDARYPARGIPLFAAVHKLKDVTPHRAVPAMRHLKSTFDHDLVRHFAALWYREDARAMRVPEGLVGVHDLVLAAASASTLDGFRSLLFDIAKAGYDAVAERESNVMGTESSWDRQKREKREAEEKEAKDDADNGARRLASQSRTTPKLSEMKGFGPAREWGLRLAADLHAWDVGELTWDDVDKGILLSGEPGTGKTTFVKALAAEVDADFEAVTYASFETPHVSRNMKKRFDQWRKQAKTRPVLVFWDELDAMGVRGKNADNDSYWTAIINTLLDFLDGAEPRDGIVFIGATNFLDRIDPALMRAGRLDRHVVVPMPGVDEMCDVVGYHMDVDPKSPETRKAAIALRGSSPADVALWAREARRMGRLLRRKADGGDLADLVEWSRPKLHPRQDRLVRIHESGHAIATLTMEAHGWKLAQVDTQASRRAGSEVEGTVECKLPPWTMTRRDIVRQIAQTLAGRAAEEVHIGEVSVGARADLQNATALAAKAIRQEGLGRTLLHVAPDSNVTDEHMVEIELMIGEGYELAKQCVAGWDVPWLAERLKEQRFMSGDEVRTALRAAIAEVFFREDSAPEPQRYEPCWEDSCPPEALAA